MTASLISTLDSVTCIPAAFFAQAKLQPEQIIFSQAVRSGSERKLFTRAQVAEKIVALARNLQKLGVKQGDRVAIISNTRPEWLITDLAIQSVGAITVAIYQTLPAADVGYILYDSEVKFVFVENQEQADKVLQISREDFSIPAVEDRAAHMARINLNQIISFEDVQSEMQVEKLSLANLSASDWQSFELPAVSRADLATFVYTSGTTGPAKAVMQTHANHLANVRQVVNCGLINNFPAIMLFLPLAHSFARLMAYLGALTPCALNFPSICDTKTSKVDLNQVTKDIQRAGLLIVPLVPRVLEKMQAGIQELMAKPGIKNTFVRLAVNSALECYRLKQKNLGIGVKLRIIYEGTAALRSAIKKQLFGEGFGYCVSGGAKLNPEVTKFFDALGIEVLEGYGLTETCVATNINPVGRKQIGTVGPAIDSDLEMRINPDGEICFRGPNITQGYLNRPQATAASWDADGWFYTGDLGSVNEDGYLSIVGRKKEIIVNSYGKNISCLNVEQALTNSEYISQAVIIGEAKPFAVALIVPNWNAIKLWAAKKNIPESQLNASNAEVIALLEVEVARANEQLASFEAIKKFKLLAEEFSIENGLLTPTMKIKRSLVEQQYRAEIDSLYE